MKLKKVRSIPTNNGFTQIRQTGSHRQFTAKIEGKTGHVTLAYHQENDDIKPNTLNSIIRQSGLDKNYTNPLFMFAKP